MANITKLMDLIQDEIGFVFPDRRYQRIAIRYRDIDRKLSMLNDRRKTIQKRLSELDPANPGCIACRGWCCKVNDDLYTEFDYLIRMFSDKPLKSYGKIRKMPSMLNVYFRELLSFFRPVRADFFYHRTGCAFLTPTGCGLDPEDKPMRCAIYTCKLNREHLPPGHIAEMRRLTNELSRIPQKILNLFR